jgi:hypothetical protein
MLYWLAVETGLRANERRSLTSESFNLKDTGAATVIRGQQCEGGGSTGRGLGANGVLDGLQDRNRIIRKADGGRWPEPTREIADYPGQPIPVRGAGDRLFQVITGCVEQGALT